MIMLLLYSWNILDALFFCGFDNYKEEEIWILNVFVRNFTKYQIVCFFYKNYVTFIKKKIKTINLIKPKKTQLY